MARNDFKQNPESEERRTDAKTGSEKSPESGVQKQEDVTLEDIGLLAELFDGDSDDESAEDILLETEFSDLLAQVQDAAAEPEEDSEPASDNLPEEDFAESDEYIEIPMAEEEPEEKDILAYAPPAEEEPEKKGFLAGLFGGKKAADNRRIPQEPAPAAEEETVPAAEEPVLAEPAENNAAEPDEPALDTGELAFVTDSIPVTVGMMAKAAAALSGDAEEANAVTEETEDPAEIPEEEIVPAEKPGNAPHEKKPENPNAALVRMVATLTIICCVVAMLLAAVNAVTADVITANAEKKQADAILRIFTDGTDVVPYGDNVWLVYKDDTVLGYCAAVAPMGYAGAIDMMVGVDAQDQIVGVQIVDMKETSGVGSKTRSDSFLSQYPGKSGPFTVGDNIDGIVGATVSSKAVTEGVNMALALDVRFDGSVPETEAETEPVMAETETETEPVVPETEPETETEKETEPETEKETEKEPETEKKPETIPPETVPPVPETKPETTPPAPETQPETEPVPVETQPETEPAPETESETDPAETEPETDPAETEPETDPAETEPETDPAETEPETDPAETEPETDSAETEPETDPAETEPETDPAETEEDEGELDVETETTGSRLPIRY